MFYLFRHNYLVQSKKNKMDTVVTLLDHVQLATTIASLFAIYVFARVVSYLE